MEDGSVKITKMKRHVSNSLCVVTTVILSLLCTALLFVTITALNGTVKPIRLWNYVRPSNVGDQNDYIVVVSTMRQCHEELPMRIHSLTMTPDPFVMPDADLSDLKLAYDMTLLADIPKEITIELLLQRLNPPWAKVECVDGSGSCKYEMACDAVGKIFGFDSCLDMKPGNHTKPEVSLDVDLTSTFQWAKQPGNYFAQVRALYRHQPFACMNLSFRIRDKP